MVLNLGARGGGDPAHWVSRVAKLTGCVFSLSTHPGLPAPGGWGIRSANKLYLVIPSTPQHLTGAQGNGFCIETWLVCPSLPGCYPRLMRRSVVGKWGHGLGVGGLGAKCCPSVSVLGYCMWDVSTDPGSLEAAWWVCLPVSRSLWDICTLYMRSS